MAKNEIDVRELINQRPVGRFQKMIIFLGFLVIALDGFDITLMGFIVPELKVQWGVANHQLGWVISAALVGLTLGALLSGPLSDRLGRRVIIINSVFFFGFWTIVTAFSQNIEQMIFFRFMTGLGMGAAMPNVGTLISEYAPEKKRSFIITIVFCGFTFGAALGGFAASWLIPRFGWHSLLLLAGILPLLSVPLLLLKLPESVRFLVTKRACAKRISKIVEKLAPGSTNAETCFVLPAVVGEEKGAVRIVLSEHYRFGSVMLWIGYFMALFLVYLLGSWLPTLVKSIGLSLAQAAVVTALYQAGGTFGSLFAGWMMDRVNPHRALAVIYLVGAVFTLSIGQAADNGILLGVLAFGCGFCLNGANTGMNALSAGYYPTEARATGSSWMHGIGRTGAILSAFAGAQMLALGWDFSWLFAIIAIPAVVTAGTIFAKGIWGYQRQSATSKTEVVYSK